MDGGLTKIVVDSEGDVLLVVGDDDARRSIQVSSKMLSSASKVFKAMFSRKFKEGSDLANR